MTKRRDQYDVGRPFAKAIVDVTGVPHRIIVIIIRRRRRSRCDTPVGYLGLEW
jgi:hypothetical protein